MFSGAIAGLTIFFGLPIARTRRLSPNTVALLNALAIGILLYLVIEIAQNAIAPISQGSSPGTPAAGAFPFALIGVFVGGLLVGLVGLGSAATHSTRRAAQRAENPMVLAAIIAIGIGAHNFGEGLAIGASAASGATAIALALIVGFGLHNATEGFGVAAPLVGRVVPSWAQIGLAGLDRGRPNFVGTIVGYSFYSPTLSVLFLAIAIGALVFVIGELWSVLRAPASPQSSPRRCGRVFDRPRNRTLSRHERGIRRRNDVRGVLPRVSRGGPPSAYEAGPYRGTARRRVPRVGGNRAATPVAHSWRLGAGLSPRLRVALGFREESAQNARASVPLVLRRLRNGLPISPNPSNR